MPTAQQHEEKFLDNQGFLNRIISEEYHDWTAVTMFYAAVHLVERLRAHKPPSAGSKHSTNHSSRRRFIQRSHKTILSAYASLFTASLIARYESRNDFNTQFPEASVRTELLARLNKIEQYVSKKVPKEKAKKTGH